MTTPIPDFQTLLERLEKLETQNRRLRRIGLVTLISFVAVAAVLAGVWFRTSQPPPPSKTVEAERFVLRDGDGKVRAQLAAGEHGQVFVICDDGGRERVALGVNQFGPGLVLKDSGGASRAVLCVDGKYAGMHLDTRRGQIGRRPGLGPEARHYLFFTDKPASDYPYP